MRNRLLSAKDVWAIAFLVVLVALFFGEVLFHDRVYYGGDLARIYLPQRVALHEAIGQRQLPLWSSRLGAGYPLAAEGETGALYPPNWFTYALLSPELGLTVSLLAHFGIGWLGLYVFARELSLSRGAAILAGTVWTFGGFNVAHLSHASITTVAAWYPWMFALTHGLLHDDVPARRWRWALGLAMVVGLQFLAGHAQISLLGLLAVTTYALYVTWPAARRRGIARLSLWLGALALGTLLGLPQILASLELSTLSQRAGGLEESFFTSYSFHPLLLSTYLSPFLLGNPYPDGSIELMGYVGLLPLALAATALRRQTRRKRGFFLLLAAAGLVLALGRWNPLYRYLRHVPVLGLFRVPARYLYWVTFSLAILAGQGLDDLGRLTPRQGVRAGLWLCGLAGLVIVSCVVATLAASDVDHLVRVWRWLPLLLALGVLATVLAASQSPRSLWLGVAGALLCVDLWAYGAVLDGTYNRSSPRDAVTAQPQSLAFLRQGDELYRVLVKEEIVPALSVMRESLYPNLALGYGLDSANLYLPLVPQHYASYVDSLSVERLNRLNIKYYMIPQLLPVDAVTELYDVSNPFAALPTGRWLEIGARELAGVQVESFLSHSAHLGDGELTAEILVRGVDGRVASIPVRAGIETAEWAYERDDVRAQIAHAKPPVASTWPARSGFPARAHPGHTFFAEMRWPEPVMVDALMVRPVLPEAFVRVEQIRLLGVGGESDLLNHLVGLGDHAIAYRSEDVLVYRNDDVLPRAFVAPASSVRLDAEGLMLPQRWPSDAVVGAQVVSYQDQHVVVSAVLSVPGYLVLADMDYPGWRALVDGQPRPIVRADGLFRAVYLGPGEHRIEFVYEPHWAVWH